MIYLNRDTGPRTRPDGSRQYTERKARFAGASYMNRTTLKIFAAFALCLIAVFASFFCGWFLGAGAGKAEEPEETPTVSLHSATPDLEYLVGSAVYQLSAETDGLTLQGFGLVRHNAEDMLALCADETQPDWQLVTNAAGENEMYHGGKRVAIIADIDDTLVNGVNYTADILGSGGDWNNASFARFLLSDGCTALPGAVECINFCHESGIEVFYVTNRYDQGYKVGQADSHGSYEQYQKEHGDGTYTRPDGTLIGTSIYELFGMSMYDITLFAMQKLGFPIDDGHLLLNDLKLNGSSKESCRLAVINGCTDFPNGQREHENSLSTALTVSMEPHEVVMLLGDQLSDFTDDPRSQGTASPVDRKAFAATLAEKFGREWILFPNAVYGQALDSGMNYGPKAFFNEFSYTNN